jgi:hypothetical protein
MQKYILVQKRKIEIEKWCEGCRIKRDPGKEFVLNWIFENAAWFRNAWDKAVCKKCYFVDECGFDVKQYCKNFKEINKDKVSS